jgi:hypothetical protein
MNTQELLDAIQMDYNLEMIETTTGRNGYPQSLKKALIGFQTFEQAQEIANKYPEVRITTFHKRDGWQLWERNNDTAYEPLQNSASDFGDDYNQFTSEDVEDYFENEVKPFLEDFENFETLNEFLKEREEVLNKIQLLDDNELVITYQGRYYDTIEKKSMSFYHDTHHYAIGIIID